MDPIDGTVNFLYGIEDFAVSMGAAIDGEIVAGAVINVARETLYSAAPATISPSMAAPMDTANSSMP